MNQVSLRAMRELNKLIDLRDKYGLQDQGHAEIHMLWFVLTGDLIKSSKVSKLTEEQIRE